jgi:assimilatory nitrate reductase catalytic subunit
MAQGKTRQRSKHMQRQAPMSIETRTTCPYCGVGCGVIAAVAEDGAVAVRGDPDHPASFGRLCSKGSALAETLDRDGRIAHPEIGGRQAGWDDALDLVAEKFGDAIARHGPDSVAFYVSGQCLTEDYYVANKLMKGFIGSANIDTNSRLCMASSVAGHRRAFGSDTVPGTYEDLECADLVVLVGSNMAWCHPVLFQRMLAARERRPEMRIVVVDTRRTATSDSADLTLEIRPDGDVALFNGLLAHLAASPAFDAAYVAAHTAGLPDALEAARRRTIGAIAEETGLTPRALTDFYRLFERSERVVTCYSQGVNQSAIGTDKVNAILNCHLVTGRIGKPGAGPFSLTGQPNAMGGREVGGLANMLAAHMAIESAADRDRVQRFWQSPAIPEKAGLKAVELFEAVADGRIKALWIMATNPVVSMPDADRVRTALSNCPFVVVSDIQRDTDTARLAHVLLPSTGWGEKNGTVTNSERRISRQRSFLLPPDGARPDWWQLTEVARRMGFSGAFAYRSAADIFAEHAALSGFENGGSRDFDIGAHATIDADGYAALEPFQWPQPAGHGRGDTRFFADGRFFTPDGKARFIATSATAPSEAPASHPLVLNTGRIRDQWHTMTRTGKSARLSAHIGEPLCEINPQDARQRGIEPATLVRVTNPRASVIVRALVTDRQPRGGVFVPMHWSDENAASGRIGALVAPSTDPISGQPALKAAAVDVGPARMVAYGFGVMARRPGALALPYWAAARCVGGWRIEFALSILPESMSDWLCDTFAIAPETQRHAYADAATGRHRLACFDGERLEAAFYIGSEPVAVSRQWAAGLLASSHPQARDRFAVLAGRAGSDRPDPGATVCACFSVGANQIAGAVAGGCRSIADIGRLLGAGTNCGSCRSEIKGIIDGCHRHAAE